MFCACIIYTMCSKLSDSHNLELLSQCNFTFTSYLKICFSCTPAFCSLNVAKSCVQIQFQPFEKCVIWLHQISLHEFFQMLFEFTWLTTSTSTLNATCIPISCIEMQILLCHFNFQFQFVIHFQNLLTLFRLYQFSFQWLSTLNKFIFCRIKQYNLKFNQMTTQQVMSNKTCPTLYKN